MHENMHEKQHRQILVEQDNNSICFCPHCERVSITYGRAMLAMESERFEDFTQFLTEAFARHFQPMQQQELRLRFSDVYLCFDREEAQGFLSLVNQAWTEICRQRLETTFAL